MSDWTRRGLMGGGALSAGVAALATLACEVGREIEPAPATPDPRTWPDHGLHAAWIGHTTVLLKIDGFTILTDPIFSDRAGINILGPLTLGRKRLVEPALTPERLPKVDLLLLTHAHMDHFDIPSLGRLERKDLPVVTAWSTSDLLRVDRYREVREMRWGDRTRIGPVLLHAFQVKHWGTRLRSDNWRGYNGYVIEAGRYRVLFAGDTAITDLFRNLKTAKSYDLAIMPIGAYNPWIRVHCTPEQAWQMGNAAGADRFLPVHHQTFALSREPRFEPIERFQSAAANRQDRIVVRRVGQEFHFS